MVKELLQYRTHQTKITQCLSEVVQLLSGVVQGSVIGLLMFFIFVLWHIKVNVFADDFKSIYKTTWRCQHYPTPVWHLIDLLAKLYRKQLAKVKVAGTLSEWFLPGINNDDVWSGFISS